MSSDDVRMCPDGGTCHHQCGASGACFRVEHCAPLSGVFPADKWPEDLRKWPRLRWIQTRHSALTLEVYLDPKNMRQIARVWRRAGDYYEWSGLGGLGSKGEAESLAEAQSAAVESARSVLKRLLEALDTSAR